ncbi:MAG: hypothetical protein WAU91_10725 [Desulfatitalea sp.]
MLDITIPLWFLLTVAGLPAVILIALSARLIRMKRKQHTHATSDQMADIGLGAPVSFNEQIHRQLLEQQIDAVFNVLSILIETERVKLKALVSHALPVAEAEPPRSARPEKAVDLPQINEASPMMATVPVTQNIANLAQEGLAAGEIARRLGLSLSEVALALKMKAGRNAHVGRKMQAVA